MTTDRQTIMIVDDEPANLSILDAILRRAHYAVAAFPRGDLALAAVSNVRPDMVLLDVSMPLMNGYDVCRRLKSDDQFKNVPVLFLSALSEADDKVSAFQAGAVDFISKPVSRQEVLARVRTHLSLRRRSLLLEELVRQRTCEIELAHRRLRVMEEAKTAWIQTLAHELRTPLTGIFCIADTLLKGLPQDASAAELRADYQRVCGRVRKLIDDATTLATIDVSRHGFETERVGLREALQTALATVRRRCDDVAFSLRTPPDDSLTISASPYLLKRALTDLLATTACCTRANGQVAIDTLQSDSRVVLCISAQGQTLPAEELAVFFSVGEQRTLHKGGADFGLGPALAHRVLQLFEAETRVRNGPDGVVIDLRLPLTPA